MNWLAIAAISETIGVIAVVISLLYLAFQIRFARLAAADTSRTAWASLSRLYTEPIEGL